MWWWLGAVPLALFYFLLFEHFLKGWGRLKKKGTPALPAEGSLPGVSVIVPFRDEAVHLPLLVRSLAAQVYEGPWEVVLVDDHSTDNGPPMLRETLVKLNLAHFRTVGSPEDAEGKKVALATGIAAAAYPVVLTTDADCLHPEKWLQKMALAYVKQKAAVVSGPVRLEYDAADTFSRWQALEFAGLNAIGAACMERGNAILANGASLMFGKEWFERVGGYRGIDNIASGDDELLVHKIEAVGGKAVFCFDGKAIVSTPAADSLGEFLAQRRRWVSKSTHYGKKHITWLLVVSWVFNLAVLASLVLLFVPGGQAWPAAALLVFVKWLQEWRLYRRALPFYGIHRLLPMVPLASLAHVGYVLVIGIYGNFGKLHWKGRRIR